MFGRSLVFVLFSALALVACGKGDGAENNEKSAVASNKPSLPEEKTLMSLPQADLAKPVSEYVELTNGSQLMFLYTAISGVPADFPKMAEASSREYRETADGFRKSDILKSIQPNLEAGIADAKAKPYYWMSIDGNDIATYDFDKKGFPVNDFSEGSYRYFNDISQYKLTWANAKDVAFSPVGSEDVARKIESMRNDYSNKLTLKVYFFGQSADMNQMAVKAFVTRVQFVDKSGSVLAEYGPAVK